MADIQTLLSPDAIERYPAAAGRSGVGETPGSHIIDLLERLLSNDAALGVIPFGGMARTAKGARVLGPSSMVPWLKRVRPMLTRGAPRSLHDSLNALNLPPPDLGRGARWWPGRSGREGQWYNKSLRRSDVLTEMTESDLARLAQQVQEGHREASRLYHPDVGGSTASPARFQQSTEARDSAMRHIGAEITTRLEALRAGPEVAPGCLVVRCGLGGGREQRERSPDEQGAKGEGPGLPDGGVG